MKIWGRANSINVMKVLWCADECGLKYEREDVGMAFGGNDQKWYLDMNPNGVVPTIDDGGRIIWESNSSVRYLAAKYAAGIAVAKRSRPAQRSRPLDGLAAQHDLRVHAGDLLGPDPHAGRQARHGGDQEGRGGCRQAVGPPRQQLEGKRYVAGAHFTMGDIPVGCFVHRWYALDVERPDLKNVEAWYERLKARPAYAKHVMPPLTSAELSSTMSSRQDCRTREAPICDGGASEHARCPSVETRPRLLRMR